jgi:hypothetical protein
MSGIITGREIEAPDVVKNILEADENVLYGFQQAGMGGKFACLESVFVTNRRLIKVKPKTLGFRSDIEDYLYRDMANVNLDKGIFRSSINIVMRFNSEPVSIENIPKEGANKIFKTIQEGIGRILEKSIPADVPALPSKIDVMEQIKKLKELKDGGALTDEEYETKKKELLSKI